MRGPHPVTTPGCPSSETGTGDVSVGAQDQDDLATTAPSQSIDEAAVNDSLARTS